MSITLPDWIRELPKGNKKNQRINRFYIRIAALYATPDGNLRALAELIGVDYGNLKHQANSICRASTETKMGIMTVLGPDFVPPDLPELHRNPKRKKPNRPKRYNKSIL